MCVCGMCWLIEAWYLSVLKHHIIITQARSKMQELMKDGYSIEKNEVCHVAQERLRQAMGIMDPNEGSKCAIA